jgi:hypothetical protein
MLSPQRLVAPVGVGLLATFVAVALSWPMVLDPTTQAIGGGLGDLNGLAWTLWRVATSLPAIPVDHPDVLFPAGATLAPVAVPQAVLLAPITLLAGPIAAANLLQVLHIALAASLASAWAQSQNAGRWGVVVAGLAFGLTPALTASVHNGNPDVTPLFWLPLVGLLAPRVRGSWAAAVGLGVATGLAAGWNPYVGVMAGLVALALVGWPNDRAEGRRLAVAFGLAAVGLAAWGAWYAGALGGAETMVLKRASTPIAPGAASLRGFFDPSAHGGGADGWTVHRWYPGLSVWALAAAGLWRRGRQAWGLSALVAIGGLLALGPVLQWDGAPVDVAGVQLALPGMLWTAVPGLDGLRLVWRYAALAAVGLAILAAHGLDALPRPWLRVGAVVVVAADLLLLGGAASDLRAGPIVDDGACTLLAGRPAGAVLSLPVDHEERALLGQTCHGRSVAGALNRPFAPTVRAALRDPSLASAQLRDLGFRWLVLHTDGPGDGGAQAAQLAQVLSEHIVAERGATALVDLGER